MPIDFAKLAPEFFKNVTGETEDEFKTNFNNLYVLKSEAAKDKTIREALSGSILGAEATNLGRTFKEFGVEFSEDEKKTIDGLPSHRNEAMVKLFAEKFQGTYVNKLSDLEKKVGVGNDEKVKMLEEKLSKTETKLTETTNAWKGLATDLETEKKNSVEQLNSFKTQTLLGKAREGVKFKQKMTDVEKMGFDAALASRFKFGISEDKLEVFAADGSRIQSKAKAGTFVDPTEAMQSLADEFGVGEVNPHGGKPAPVFSTGGLPPRTGNNQTPPPPSGKRIISGGKVIEV